MDATEAQALGEINAVDLSGTVPTTWIPRPGDREALAALKAEGAGINAEGPGAWVDQQMAYLQIHPDMSTALKARGANLNVAVGPHGRTALHLAVVWGSSESVASLMSHGAEVNGMDAQGRTALHFIAMRGREPMVSLLVASLADVNAPDLSGNTPLHHAVAQGYLDVVKALMEAKADVHMVNHAGMTALDMASLLGVSTIIGALSAGR